LQVIEFDDTRQVWKTDENIHTSISHESKINRIVSKRIIPHLNIKDNCNSVNKEAFIELYTKIQKSYHIFHRRSYYNKNLET